MIKMTLIEIIIVVLNLKKIYHRIIMNTNRSLNPPPPSIAGGHFELWHPSCSDKYSLVYKMQLFEIKYILSCIQITILSEKRSSCALFTNCFNSIQFVYLCLKHTYMQIFIKMQRRPAKGL